MVNLSIKRRIVSIRKKLRSVSKDRYRLTVSRSNKNITAQIIDDKTSKTLVAASSLEKEIKSKNKKVELSTIVGEVLAKRAFEKKINKIYFDRSGYKYHGRIKALADSLRKNGLDF